MKLTFAKYHRVNTSADLSKLERDQFVSVHEPGPPGVVTTDDDMEIVDVMDEHGKIRYVMFFYNYGSAEVFEAGTTKRVANAAQHSIDWCEDPALWAALGDAYKCADPAINQMMDFTLDEEDG